MANNCNCRENSNSSNSRDGIRYIISVGLNNQRTNSPEMSSAMAEACLQRIFSDNFDEYTIVPTVSGYRNVYTKCKYIEDSFNIELLNPSEEAVERVASLLSNEFNQSYILVQRQFVSYSIYENMDEC